jgi:RHS repeat-associated protein
MLLATTDLKNFSNSFVGSSTIGAHTVHYVLYDSSENAVQDLGTSPYTVQASPLSPPSGVTATDGTYTDKVRITWTAVTGATSYQVYRSQYSSSGYENVGTPTSTSFDDTNATAGITYYYKVKSYNATSGTSELSTSYDSGYSAVATPSVTNVSPPNATLNQLATFTVTGTNLTSGMGFTVQDCDPSNNEVGTGSSTQRTFQCTPSGTTGSKTGTVKTAPNGNSLKSFTVNVSAAPLPTITAPVISEPGTTYPYKFTVTASGPLPTDYYIALNFDDMKGGWLAEPSSPHLTAVSGNTYSGERALDYPGIRYFRAGIFNAAGVLQGSYTNANTCTLQSCLNAAINQADIKNLIGDPDISGSGSQLMRGVDVATGNFHHSATDMSVSSKGPDFTIVRAYNSYTDKEHWTFNIDAKASFTATNLLSIGPREDGHFQYFYKDLNDQKWYPLNPGNFDTLVQNTDGSLVLYTQGNLLYRFASPSGAQAGRLTKIEDRDTNAIVFGHDANNRVTSATDASGGTYMITRNTAGRITKVTDYTGRYVEYTWDTNNMIYTVRNPRNQSVTYGYNVTQLTSIKDQRLNQQATIAYTAGKVSTVTDGLNNIWGYQYGTDSGRQATLITRPAVNGENNNLGFILDDDRTRVLERIDSKNGSNYRSTTAYKFVSSRQRIAEMNLPVEKTPPLATAKTTIAYKGDGRGNPIEITKTGNATDSPALTTSLEWNAINANLPNLTPLTKVTSPGTSSSTIFDSFTASGKAGKITNPRGEVTTREYSGGLLTKTTDALTNSTILTNNAVGRGRPTRIDDAMGNYTAFAYDTLGRVTSARNARGFYTYYTYDENDNVLTVRRPLDGVNSGADDIKITNTYDASDNLISTTDPLGYTTTFTYDILNRKTEEHYTAGGQQRVRRFEYDAMGRLYRAFDEKNNMTENRFDARNKVKSTIDPLSQSVTYTYDGNGNVLTVTDAVSRKVTFTYDALDRKITSVDSLGNTERFAYNERGLLESKTDGRNQTTRYEYDILGRMAKVIDADGSTTQATYDANGNLATTIDRNNKTTRYTYDKLNRLSQLTDPLNRIWKFSYDSNGNLISRIMPSAKTITYTYDKLDRLSGVNYPGGPTVSYTYDLNGNRKTMTDAQGTTSYNYDERDRLTSVTNAFGLSVGYSYDAAGLLQQLTYPGSHNVSYVYDNASRLKSLTDWLNHTTTYTRDNSGLITAIQYGNGAKIQPTYDNAGRLNSLVNRNAANALISSHVLTLDGAGLPTSANVDLPLMPANLGKAADLIYDASNRLDKVGVAAITHDADGRVVADASGTDPIQYAYNAQDLITTVTKNSVLTDTYSYDGDGRRTQRVSGSQTTRYLLDPTGGDLYRLLAETDGSNAVQRYYVYGAGLVSQISGTSHHYYHFDPSGNTLALTNDSGVVTDTYAYEPFGNTTTQGTTSNPFRFVGQHGVMDDGNGLHHMRARYYKPDLRRFVSLDALHGEVTDPMSLNRYQYVSGNPMIGVDPSGMAPSEGNISVEEERLRNAREEVRKKIVKLNIKNKINKLNAKSKVRQNNFAKPENNLKMEQYVSNANDAISKVAGVNELFKPLGEGGFIKGSSKLGRSIKNVNKAATIVTNGLTIIDGGLKVVNGQGSATGQGLNAGISVATSTTNILSPAAAVSDLVFGTNASSAMASLQEAAVDPIARDLLAEKGIRKAESDGTIQCVNDPESCNMNFAEHFIFVVGNALSDDE